MDVEGILGRMRAALNVENNFQMSKALGLSHSAARAWRSREKIPFEACYKIYKMTGVSIEWLVDGENPRVDNVDASSIDFDSFSSAFSETICAGVLLGAFAKTRDYEELSVHLSRMMHNKLLELSSSQND